MKKKLFVILILSLSISNTLVSYAGEITENQTIQTEAVEEAVIMDIDTAVEYAQNNSDKIKSVQSDSEMKRYQWIDARRNYINFQKKPYEAATFEVSLLRRGYYVDMTELTYNSSLRTIEIEKLNLKNQVKTDIYTYYNNLKKQELAKKNLDNASEKRTFAKARLDNGTISQLDYTLFELSVVNAENSLKQAERNAALSLSNIKSTINYPQENELTITGSMPEIAVSYLSADEAIAASRTQNTYLVLADSFEAAKKRLTAAEGYYFPSEIAFQIEKYTYDKAEADFRINVDSLDNGIRTTYNKLLDIGDSIAYTKQYLDYLEKNTLAAYTKYEMGMITANSYVETEQEYYKAQNDYMDLLLSYRTAALQYKALYTNEDDELQAQTDITSK